MKYLFHFFETSTLWFFGMCGVVTALLIFVALIIYVSSFLREEKNYDDEFDELWS